MGACSERFVMAMFRGRGFTVHLSAGGWYLPWGSPGKFSSSPGGLSSCWKAQPRLWVCKPHHSLGVLFSNNLCLEIHCGKRIIVEGAWLRWELRSGPEHPCPGSPLTQDLFQNPQFIDEKTEAGGQGGGQRAGLRTPSLEPLYTQMAFQLSVPCLEGVPRFVSKAL